MFPLYLLAQGGLGKVQFAITTQHLLDNLADPSLVVCAGVAGSLTKSARVGDVVVGTATVEHDFNDSDDCPSEGPCDQDGSPGTCNHCFDNLGSQGTIA